MYLTLGFRSLYTTGVHCIYTSFTRLASSCLPCLPVKSKETNHKGVAELHVVWWVSTPCKFTCNGVVWHGGVSNRNLTLLQNYSSPGETEGPVTCTDFKLTFWLLSKCILICVGFFCFIYCCLLPCPVMHSPAFDGFRGFPLSKWLVSINYAALTSLPIAVCLGREGLLIFVKDMILLQDIQQKDGNAYCTGCFVYTMYTMCWSLLFVCG